MCLIHVQVKARGPPSEVDSSIGAQLMRLRDPRTGEPLADDHLLPQITVLFWAAFDTTGNTMAWTLYCVSQHPEVHPLANHCSPPPPTWRRPVLCVLPGARKGSLSQPSGFAL